MNQNKTCTISAAAAMLFLSAIFGAIIAVGQRPVWQDPVETAQVLAGVVSYPADNPFGLFHSKVWSILNQILALVLAAGFPESVASHLVAATVGATSFMGTFLVAEAVGGRPLAALMTPLFMYSLSLVGASSAYPITLLGSPSSYGIIGLSFALVVIGLLGTGRYRTGAFLAALAPAVHPGMGTFCVGLAAVSVLANLKKLRPELTRITAFFTLGALITAASLAWQIHFARHLPGGDASLKGLYLDAYVKNFDFHRTAGNWDQPGVLFAVMLSAVALGWLRKKEIPVGARILFTSIIVSVATTFALVLASGHTTTLAFLKVLIPWRFLNYANICIIPTACGLLAPRLPESDARSPLLFILLAGTGFVMRLLALPADNILYFCIVGSLLGILFFRPFPIPDKGFTILKRIRFLLILSVTALIVARQVIPGGVAIASGKISLKGRTTTDIYRVASQRPGLLLTAGDMHQVQLVTRRPVLLDGGALDMFPYVLESGPRFNEILNRVYGLDLFTRPPEEAHFKGMLTYFHRQAWEQRTGREWQALRAEFGVTDILTPDGWQLRLPLVTRGAGLALYTIP